MPRLARGAKKLYKHTFLTELRKGKGIKEICREYGYKSPSIIYSWKKKDKRFAHEVDLIMSSPAQRERLAVVQQGSPEGKNWRERFFTELRRSKDRICSCDAAGISATKLFELIDPEHENYDLEFKLRYDEEMNREAIQIEDEVKKKALLENSLNTQKWILPYLPVVGKKYGRYEGRLKQFDQQNNLLIVTADGLSGAGKILNELFGPREVIELSSNTQDSS